MVDVGALYPLTKDEEVDSNMPSLPIRVGLNAFGRNDHALFTKEISRKHISITVSGSGRLEVLVEGPNPVVLRSGSERKKLSPKSRQTLTHGDVIEFIPRKFPFKYVSNSVSVVPQTRTLSAVVPHAVSKDEQISGKMESQVDEDEALARLLQEEDELSLKRKSQVDEDESLARLLQEEENKVAGNGLGASGFSSARPERVVEPEAKRSKAAFEGASGGESTFQLLQTHAIPRWANNGSIKIQDVIRGDIQVAILSNYMVDLNWLLSACPTLKRVPQVVMIHGEGGQSLELLQKSKPNNWILFKPPLRLSYGTHHSKAMFLTYPTGVRIVVHTANLIYVDWNNKTQGLWMQDFPLKDSSRQMSRSVFENDLVEYLEALEWPGCTAAFLAMGEGKINANYFRKFDYSAAAVRLVGSVPGYHRNNKLTKWGHMKLRKVLEEQLFEDEFQGSSLVYQFSSLGSLDEKWLSELKTSMSAGCTFGKKPLGMGNVQIVWPTVEDIRNSLEGYAAGNAVPSPDKNVKKEFLKKYWAHWKAEHTGRSRAIPHMKSYVRYNGHSLAWFLLTSSNLSKAAWGALQKNGTQLMIRSYELGVCFLPSLVLRPSIRPFSCTDDTPSLTKGVQLKALGPDTEGDREQSPHGKLVIPSSVNGAVENLIDNENVVRLPVPYSLPPPSYGPEDVPWSWDREYKMPDVYGEVWPRLVQLYQ